MDDVAHEIHDLVRKFCEEDIDEPTFTSQIGDVVQRHPNPGNIGRAVDKGLRVVDASVSERDRIWQLTNSIDSAIKSEFDEWSDASNWNID